MKKLNVLLIISLILISVISIYAYAEDNKKGNSRYNLEDIEDEDSSDSIDSSNVETRSKFEMEKSRLKNVELDEKSFKLREFSEEQIKKYRELAETGKQKFMSSLVKAEKLKNYIQQNGEKVRECKKETRNSTLCKNLTAQAFDNGKQYLLNTIDALSSHLNSLDAQVQGTEELDDDDVKYNSDTIQLLLAKLSELRSQVESATTKDQLVQYSKNLKNLLNDVKEDSFLSTEKIRAGRVGEIVVRAEHLQAQLASVQYKFGQNITNNTELNNLVNKFNAKIDDAKSNYNQALAKLDDAKSIKRNSTGNLTIINRRQLIQEAHALLVQAHEDLKDAHELLKQIFKMLKGIEKDIDFNDVKCYENRPLFIPGKDLGVYVWQSTCNDKTINLVWNGNAKSISNTTTNVTNATELITHVTGTITTNGEFKDLILRRFESKDSANLTNNNTITFDGYVSTDFDSIIFKTTGTQVTMDLTINGEKNTNLIFIGQNATNPSSVPFTLDVKAANLTNIQCKDHKYLVNGTCSKISGITEQEDNHDGEIEDEEEDD